MKNKKKREAKKAAKKDEGESVGPIIKSNVQINLTGDPETDKKLKNIKKVLLIHKLYQFLSLKWVCVHLQKLDAIEKLKEQQAQGKTLEVNQLAKIKGEADLIKELEQLQV